MKKDLITILDLSVEEIDALLARASALKEKWKKGVLQPTLAGRTLGLLFDKPSTRTRVSFEVAMYQLGGQVVFMSSKETQLSRDESLQDTALVLSRYIDVLLSAPMMMTICRNWQDTLRFQLLTALPTSIIPVRSWAIY